MYGQGMPCPYNSNTYSLHSMEKIIEHEGTVIKNENGHIAVSIISQTACAGCHAKSACNLSDSTEKIIEIHSADKVTIGQKVMIIGNQTQNNKAVLLAYILPVIIIITILAVTVSITKNEALAGFLSILFLIIYFISLRAFNDRLKKTFSFKIETINH